MSIIFVEFCKYCVVLALYCCYQFQNAISTNKLLSPSPKIVFVFMSQYLSMTIFEQMFVHNNVEDNEANSVGNI